MGDLQSAARPAVQATGGAPTGALGWGLGLLVLVPIPVASVLIAGLAMVVAGLSSRPDGGNASRNGRNAANWGLTYILLTAVLLGLVLCFALSADALPGSAGSFVLQPLFCWLLVSVGHLVFVIIGLVRAGRGEVYRAPAIPFFGRH